MEAFRMYGYNLDRHLQTCCNEQPEYLNLYSTWNLNKKTCSDALKTVLISYPHFSMHDSSHAETILSCIEMLLGDRISKISPTDTWMLLHAAYAHDLGMILTWKQIESVWESQKFQNFLLSLTETTDNELQNAVLFIRNIKEHSNCSVWPLKAHRYVNLINATYFREKHAHMSQEYIEVLGSELKIDLGHSNLIQPRLLKLLGKVCELHTSQTEEVLKLDYKTDGFSSDYAHPRFVAMLLRLGDLLDIDNGRFNITSELVAGGLPESSVPHKDKHNATTHILITPEEIQFRSDCSNDQAYLETRKFITWLEKEVNFLTVHWAQIVPEGLGGYAPCFSKKEILINGIPDFKGVVGLRFEISQEKAFQIIEGSNIYSDPFVFIREVIQNAMDASKLQLWNDLSSGTYFAWIGDQDVSKLQPYNLESKIFENYPIKIRLSTLSDGTTQIEISDRGTGISIAAFKHMCNVGVSNSGFEKLQEEDLAIPNWLRPTAGFGVGLQSIFLLTNQFEIDTCDGAESFHAVAHSNKTGGYIQLQRTSSTPIRGTTIRINFHMPKEFSYSVIGSTDNYLSFHYDPMSIEDHTGEARIMDAINSSCVETMFPIFVDCAEKNLGNEKIVKDFPMSRIDSTWKLQNSRYYYLLGSDCSSIYLWDIEKAIYAEFRLRPRGYYISRVLFKGMEIEKRLPNIQSYGIQTLIDIYGMDTKSTISLDRSSFTRQGAGLVGRTFTELLKTYIELVLEKLTNNDTEQQKVIYSSTNFNLYTFWLLCNQEQRSHFSSDMLREINEEAIVFIKDDKHKYIKSEKKINELISKITEIGFLNLDEFETQLMQSPINYQEINEVLNLAEKKNYDIIVADKEMTTASCICPWKSIEIPVLDRPLILHTISDENKVMCISDNSTKTIILRGLSNYIRGLRYNVIVRDKKAKRYGIPALSDYSDIAVEELPHGIAVPVGGFNYYVIAPFQRDEADKCADMPAEKFIDYVMSSEAFHMVIRWVKEHSHTKEGNITIAYKKLIEEYCNAMKGM